MTDADANKETALHPAAGVFLNWLLVDVGEENRQFAEDIDRLADSKRFLGKISIVLDGGDVVMSSLLVPGALAEGPDGIPVLCIQTERSAHPLSEYRSGKVKMANLEIGTLPAGSGRRPVVLLDRQMANDGDRARCRDGSVRLRFSFAEGMMLEGVLSGIHDEDIALFRDPGPARPTEGDRRVTQFLETGGGLCNAESLTFTPDRMYLFLEHNLRETVGLLGIEETYIDNVESSLKDDPLLVDPSGRVVCSWQSPSDETRLRIVDALGGSESHLELLKDNLELRNRSRRFSKIDERIDQVALSYDNLRSPYFSLRNGELAADEDGAPVWQVSLKIGEVEDGYPGIEHCPIIANMIGTLSIVVSGIHFDLATFQFGGSYSGVESLQRRELTFVAIMECGVKIEGYWDHQTLLEENAVGSFEEFLAGNGPCPEFLAVATTASFPLESIRKTLEVLGVEKPDNYDNTDGSTSDESSGDSGDSATEVDDSRDELDEL
ncbi:hypothetical protein ACHAXT_008916 [Thalassiosira profunda]